MGEGIWIVATLLALGLVLLRTSRRRALRLQGNRSRLSMMLARQQATAFAQPGAASAAAAQPHWQREPDELFTVAFTYIDARGLRSERVVAVTVCDQAYFAGHCFRRDGYRTFSWDGVVGEMLVDSGETLTAAALRVRHA